MCAADQMDVTGCMVIDTKISTTSSMPALKLAADEKKSASRRSDIERDCKQGSCRERLGREWREGSSGGQRSVFQAFAG